MDKDADKGAPSCASYDEYPDFDVDQAVNFARVGNLETVRDFLITLSASVKQDKDFLSLEIGFNNEHCSISYGICRTGKPTQFFKDVFVDLAFSRHHPIHFVFTLKAIHSALSFEYLGSCQIRTKPGGNDITLNLASAARHALHTLNPTSKLALATLNRMSSSEFNRKILAPTIQRFFASFPHGRNPLDFHPSTSVPQLENASDIKDAAVLLRCLRKWRTEEAKNGVKRMISLRIRSIEAEERPIPLATEILRFIFYDCLTLK